MKLKYYKKIILILLIVITPFLLFSCEKKTEVAGNLWYVYDNSSGKAIGPYTAKQFYEQGFDPSITNVVHPGDQKWILASEDPDLSSYIAEKQTVQEQPAVQEQNNYAQPQQQEDEEYVSPMDIGNKLMISNVIGMAVSYIIGPLTLFFFIQVAGGEVSVWGCILTVFLSNLIGGFAVTAYLIPKMLVTGEMGINFGKLSLYVILSYIPTLLIIASVIFINSKTGFVNASIIALIWVIIFGGIDLFQTNYALKLITKQNMYMKQQDEIMNQKMQRLNDIMEKYK